MTTTYSPYLVTGNLLVLQGVTLTIDPGVTIEFAPNRGMQVNGTLIARGTVDQPITFTSPFASPLPGDWASIVVASSASPATYDGSGNYTGGTILEYVSVLYAGGNGATAALKIGTSAPYVHNVTIEYSAAEGLYANGPINLLMDGVTIANNAATGVQMDGGTTVLQNSSLTTNGGAGVQQNGGTLTVQNTTVDHSTGTGIATTGNATVNVLSSTVQNSGGDGVNANGAYAVLTILTTTLQYNAGAGVYLTGCNQCWNWYRPNLTVQASTVSHNGRGVDFSTPYGALFSITASVISNTVQDNNGVGIHAGDYWWGGCCWSTSDSVLIQGNLVTGNTGWAVTSDIDNGEAQVLSNTISGNAAASTSPGSRPTRPCTATPSRTTRAWPCN